MNRTTTNIFENVLYKVLFAIDDRTTPVQLSQLLEVLNLRARVKKLGEGEAA